MIQSYLFIRMRGYKETRDTFIYVPIEQNSQGNSPGSLRFLYQMLTVIVETLTVPKRQSQHLRQQQRQKV